MMIDISPRVILLKELALILGLLEQHLVPAQWFDVEQCANDMETTGFPEIARQLRTEPRYWLLIGNEALKEAERLTAERAEAAAHHAQTGE